jgi:hypothetical protein
MHNRITLGFQILFAFFLLYTSLSLYIGKTDWAFIQFVNLIFHEAGHVIFMPFGTFLHILGGALGELLIPSIVAVHFYLQKNLYATGFGLWWLSTAFFSVSVYAKDAQAQLLPLLGGDSVGHDWTNILSMLGILQYDQFVGNFFLVMSMFWVSASLLCFVRALEPKLVSAQ